MREYETVFIFDAALDGEVLDKQVGTVTSLITEYKGNVLLEQRWGRRRLAYPINKKSDGVYVYVRYEGNNELLSELDRRSKLNEAILRYQTIALDHAYVQPISAIVEAAAESAAAEGDEPAAESSATDAPAAPAAENA